MSGYHKGSNEGERGGGGVGDGRRRLGAVSLFKPGLYGRLGEKEVRWDGGGK